MLIFFSPALLPVFSDMADNALLIGDVCCFYLLEMAVYERLGSDESQQCSDISE